MAQGRPLALAVGAIALLSVSGLTLLWNLDQETPEFVPSLLQQHPKYAMRTAAERFRETGGQIDEVNLPVLRTFAARAPLEEEAFVYIGASLTSNGEFEKAEKVLREAVRRNPRSREGRLFLLGLIAQRGEVEEAIQHIEILYRLLPNHREQLRASLVALASVPSTRREALGALRDNSLKIEVIRALARNGASASMVLDSLEAVGAIDLGENPAGLVESLVNPLVQAGDWQGAIRLWRYFNPTAAEAQELLVDPRFTGEYGPPFGWSERASNHGYARLGERGLIGEFYGRRNTELARQVLILEPGDYMLSVTSANVGRGIGIEIECPGSGTIVEQSLDEAKQAIRFNVGGACPAVNLKIVGRAADPPIATEFAINEIQLERVVP